MKVIVVGCGRVRSDLAYRLFKKDHDVAVIDNVPAAFDNLPPDFRGRIVEGEALNQDVLRRAGIEEADGLAAVTNSDALNAVVAHLARAVYDVPHVVVRNYDPRALPLHEAFGLQVVSSSTWGAQRLEELLYHKEVRTVFSAGNGEVEIYEFMIHKPLHGLPLRELLPPGCVPVALTRAGRACLPDPGMALEECDVVLVSATLEGIEVLRQRLREAGEE